MAQNKNAHSINATKEMVLSRLMQLCSKSEQCAHSMLDKAIKLGLSFADATAVLNTLQKEGFVDDLRYATAFARDKSKLNGWGNVKIAYQLRAKHIDEEIIEQALKESDSENAFEKLKSALIAKNKGLVSKQTPQDERYVKLMRFALSKGFKYEDVTEVLKSVLI